MIDKKKLANDSIPNERMFEPLFSFVLCKKLDGATNPMCGTTSWWACRVDKGYGHCPKKYFNIPEHAMNDQDLYNDFVKKPLPLTALHHANDYKLSFAYEQLYTVDDVIEILLNNKRDVPNWPSVNFAVFEGVYESPNGHIRLPNKYSKKISNHSVSFIDFDINTKVFKFMNSWGKEWGDNGYGYMDQKYLKKYFVESWVGISNMSNTFPVLESGSFGNFNYKLSRCESWIVKRPLLWVLEIYNYDNLIAWSFFRLYNTDDTIEIEEIFVMPDYRKNNIGNQMLSFIEKIALKNEIKNLIGYIHVQDLINEKRMKIVERFFKKKHYEIEPHNRQFTGCYWKFFKYIK